jgi:hypothetical protein
MRVIGMFRRLSDSLIIHWRSRQKKPRHKTTTGFFGAMPSAAFRPANPASRPFRELAVTKPGQIIIMIAILIAQRLRLRTRS